MKTSIQSRPNRKGSVLAAIILVAFVSIVIASFLVLSNETALAAEKNFMHNALYNVAETGADKAMSSLKTKDWSEWTKEGENYVYRSRNNVPLGNGRMCTLNVLVKDAATKYPTVVSEGYIETGIKLGMIDRRQLRIGVSMLPKHIWGRDVGMVARNSVSFNGSKICLASFDSRLGEIPSPSSHGYDITVATVRAEQNLTFITPGAAKIYGVLASGGAGMDLSKSGLVVQGPVPPADGSNVDMERIFYDFYVEFPPVPEPPTTITKSVTSKDLTAMGAITMPTADTKAVYYVKDVLASKVNLAKGDFTLITPAGASIKGTDSITVGKDAKLTVFTMDKDFSVGGNGIIASYNKIAGQVKIYGSALDPSTQSIDIAGNGALAGVIYAPNSNLTIKGSGSSGVYYGSIIGNNVTMVGNFEFYFDVALKEPVDDETTIIGPTVTSWEEVCKITDFYEFTP